MDCHSDFQTVVHCSADPANSIQYLEFSVLPVPGSGGFLHPTDVTLPLHQTLHFLQTKAVIPDRFPKMVSVLPPLHEIKKADKVILPGVGSFGDAMSQLKKFELDKVSIYLVNN